MHCTRYSAGPAAPPTCPGQSVDSQDLRSSANLACTASKNDCCMAYYRSSWNSQLHQTGSCWRFDRTEHGHCAWSFSPPLPPTPNVPPLLQTPEALPSFWPVVGMAAGGSGACCFICNSAFGAGGASAWHCGIFFRASTAWICEFVGSVGATIIHAVQGCFHLDLTRPYDTETQPASSSEVSNRWKAARIPCCCQVVLPSWGTSPGPGTWAW